MNQLLNLALQARFTAPVNEIEAKTTPSRVYTVRFIQAEDCMEVEPEVEVAIGFKMAREMEKPSTSL